MSSDKKSKEDSKKKINNEIEIENKDLLNVFFDNSGNQFESNFYLSRKRVLNAENGQNELSDLLKSKLKALDMMLLILTNNKNILNESELSCCEVLNNLLSLSKKDKVYGEQIYSKIKTIMIYFIKNKIALKEKNIEDNRVIIKFVITLFNIKFDNNYFKQILDLISVEENILDIFIHELFNKLFKGRNITIKIKEMKYIIKSILTNDKIIKYKNYFDIMELILSYAKEKNNGGCRTGFQLNQVVFLFDLINKEDYEFDKNINKKNLDIKNDNIKRKKIFFGEMLNFLNKLKKNFDVLKEKEFSDKLEEINKLYKNIINVKYVIVVNNNNNNTNKKNKEKIKEEIVKNESEDENMKEDNNEEKEEEDKNEDKNEKNEIIEENKDEKLDKKEDKENEENEEGMNLEEEQEEEPKNQKGKGKDKKQKKDKQKKAQEEKDKEKKEKKEKKENKENKDNEKNKEMLNKKSKRKESKEKDDNKKENKNKKKKK